LQRDCLLKHVTAGQIKGRRDVRGRRGRRRKRLLDDPRKRGDIENWKRKQQISLCAELALEEAMDLS
jgi:hypothetical protein